MQSFFDGTVHLTRHDEALSPFLESTRDSERFRDGSKDAQSVSAEPGWEPGSARVKAMPAAPDSLCPAEALTWRTGWWGLAKAEL